MMSTNDFPAGAVGVPSKFLIQANPIPDIAAMVFANGEIDPLEKLEELEAVLLSEGLPGIIIFDMLLASGNTRNRYHLGLLSPTRGFLLGHLQRVEDTGQLREVSAKFMKDHLHRLRLEMLSSPIEWAVRSGVPV